jgi:hypothetical protein
LLLLRRVAPIERLLRSTWPMLPGISRRASVGLALMRTRLAWRRRRVRVVSHYGSLLYFLLFASALRSQYNVSVTQHCARYG